MIELHLDEKILLTKRRFWLPIAIEGLTMFLAAFVPLVVLIGFNIVPAESETAAADYQPFFWFLTFGWWLVLWITFFISWTNYYLDVLLITNKRVVDIEQIGLFARDLAEVRLENVQDIRVEVIGILPSLLDYGNVHIQSAGATKEFLIKNIQDPHGAKDLISKLHDEAAKSG